MSADQVKAVAGRCQALKATASTFPKSSYDLEEVLTQLGTGEAIVTVLNEKSAPDTGRVDPSARTPVLDGGNAGHRGGSRFGVRAARGPAQFTAGPARPSSGRSSEPPGVRRNSP
jgi:hypothetical protein